MELPQGQSESPRQIRMKIMRKIFNGYRSLELFHCSLEISATGRVLLKAATVLQFTVGLRLLIWN